MSRDGRFGSWRGLTRRVLPGVVAGLMLGSVGCASGRDARAENRAENRAESGGEPGRYIADFDRAWELVRDTHYDENTNGVDWDGVRDELRPRAEKARTRGENRAIISEMLGRLGQSHFGVIPEEIENPGTDAHDGESGHHGNGGAADSGAATPVVDTGDGEGNADPGFDTRIIDGRALVVSVRPGSGSDLSGVRTGWEVKRIRSLRVDELIGRLVEAVGGHEVSLYGRQVIESRLVGRPGTTIEVVFADGEGRETTLEIDRSDPPGQMVKFGNLPAMSTRFVSRWLTPEEVGGDARIGYIAFNVFMIPVAPQFERAMVAFRDADGIVIDLRGNPGGVGAMTNSLSRFFVTEKTLLGRMTMRGAELEFNAEPVVVTTGGERLGPFTGPLAIVQDGTSASTSELYAGGLRAIGRARTFGERSAGAALPANMDRLPSGDVLLHAIANYVNSDGTRLEGDGVPADVEVPVTREDLLRGIDAPLREAARWIESEVGAGEPAAGVP